MDPLFTSLATAAAKATTSEIFSKVRTAKTNKNKDQVIGELTSIINELIESRENLLLIAQGLKEKLVAQQISDDDIKYIITAIVPKLEEILQIENGISKSKEMMDQITSILSDDTLKVFQTLGFNYRQAIGEPLTQVVRDLILSKMRSDNREIELKILQNQSHNTYLAIGQKDDYSDRLEKIQETYKTLHD